MEKELGEGSQCGLSTPCCGIIDFAIFDCWMLVYLLPGIVDGLVLAIAALAAAMEKCPSMLGMQDLFFHASSELK